MEYGSVGIQHSSTSSLQQPIPQIKTPRLKQFEAQASIPVRGWTLNRRCRSAFHRFQHGGTVERFRPGSNPNPSLIRVCHRDTEDAEKELKSYLCGYLEIWPVLRR